MRIQLQQYSGDPDLVFFGEMKPQSDAAITVLRRFFT
jgi:hypothetical protein